MSNTIRDLSSTSQVNDSDLFVVSQQDKYVHYKFNSCSLSAKSLMDMLFDTVFSMQNLKDTAYMESSEFSPYVHNHDALYNKVSCEFAYASHDTYRRLSSMTEYCTFNRTIADANSLSIGNVFINGTLVPVDIPLSVVTDRKKIQFSLIEPEVGTLKFVASSKIGSNSSIDYKSNSFDGWMYPDGSLYMLSDFALSSKLRELYGNLDQTTFTLPCLSSFLKLNGKNQKYNSSAIAKCDGKNVLMKHSHTVNALCDAEAYVKIRLPANPSAGSGGTVHKGDGVVQIDEKSNNAKLFKYGNQSYTLYGLLKELNMGNSYVGGIAKMRIDKVKTLLQTIDKYNGCNLYDEFLKENTAKLSPIDNISITAQLNTNSKIGIKTAEFDGETYPSHVTLPVMIYVGQRKRDLV